MHKKWWKFAIGVPALLIFFGSLWSIKILATYNENQRLCKAIEATRHDVIKKLLNEGRDPNQQCKITYSIRNNGWLVYSGTLKYPIYVALWKKDSTTLDLLLERGADVNGLDESFPPALDYAIRNTDPQSVRVLLKHGAKPDIRDSSLVGVLSAYLGNDSANQKLEMIELLLEHNAKINFGNPLLEAVEHKEGPKLIALLIRKGADVNASVVSGGTGRHTPLHALMSYDNGGILLAGDATVLENTKLLIAKGANINAIDSRQQTPLHLLAERRTTMLTKLAITLIANGANPELKDYEKKNFFDILQARIDQEIANAQMDAAYKREPPPVSPDYVPPPTTEQRASELAEIKAFWEKHKANR